jgi:hypothetical protein
MLKKKPPPEFCSRQLEASSITESSTGSGTRRNASHELRTSVASRVPPQR